MQLVTIRKVTSETYPPPKFEPTVNDTETKKEGEHVPAHRDFREKYFLGFKKDSESDSREVLDPGVSRDSRA